MNPKPKLPPGAWTDKHGHLHFAIPDILLHLHIPDTPANREQLSKTLLRTIAEFDPSIQVIERQHPNRQ